MNAITYGPNACLFDTPPANNESVSLDCKNASTDLNSRIRSDIEGHSNRVSRRTRADADHNTTCSQYFPCRTRPNNNRACCVLILFDISNSSPTITDDFHALSDEGWYGAAYFLTSTAFLPTWGKIFQKFNVKVAFILTLFIFASGSLVSGLARQSVLFIISRAFSGAGSSGVFPGAITIVAHSVPPHRRALFVGALTSLTGVSFPNYLLTKDRSPSRTLAWWNIHREIDMAMVLFNQSSFVRTCNWWNSHFWPQSATASTIQNTD